MDELLNHKKAFDEAIANMTIAASPYFQDYVFYMHLISNCRVIYNPALQAAAGVCFKHDHYQLHINPTAVIAEGVDDKGNKVVITGFCEDMPLQHRIGILKHEMLHIANGHILRQEDRDHKGFNYATDCAINQEIAKTHLPDYVIYPENFPSKHKVPLRASAEIYYDLLDKDAITDDDEGGDGNGDENGGNTGSFGGKTPDDHGLWEESEGDATLQKELTKNMVEKAANSTQKQRGNLPYAYAQMIENLTVSREVNWKQVLRSIVGNKKANQRKTLMRKDRRLPHANWIKGKTKDRIFELAVISDVSGSVSDKALHELWGEIIHICELFHTPVKLVQVDAEAFKPEELTAKTRLVERKATGGTFLSPGIKSLRESGCHFDALVVTTDGYLTASDVDTFKELKRPVIWLIEEEGRILPEMNEERMKAIKLTGDKK